VYTIHPGSKRKILKRAAGKIESERRTRIPPLSITPSALLRRGASSEAILDSGGMTTRNLEPQPLRRFSSDTTRIFLPAFYLRPEGNVSG